MPFCHISNEFSVFLQEINYCMAKLIFYKYQGTGNDFVIIDGITQSLPNFSTSEIEQLCDRKFGIGADGLMYILPSSIADFKMQYFNADGAESTMCGNGGRCISHLAYKLGLIESKTTFEAIDGLHTAEIKDDTVKLGMISVDLVSKNEANDYILNTGSPHYVSFTTLDRLYEIIDFGKSIRYNEIYTQEGINVNLAYWNGQALDVATYERGVEDETLSCGTGVTAAAIAFATKELADSPININTKGGALKVHFERDVAAFKNIILEGPAMMTFKGEIEI